MADAAQLNFAELVSRYQKDLYLWALDLTGSREDAEDLAQETFIKVHRALDRFRGDSKCSTWIYRIARNTYLDRLKTASHKMRVLEKPLPEPSETHLEAPSSRPGANPERNMDSRDIQQELSSALSHLSPLQRDIFVLRHHHGFKIREISEILSRSEGTVKTSLFRAIQNLRQSLSHHVQKTAEVKP